MLTSKHHIVRHSQGDRLYGDVTGKARFQATANPLQRQLRLLARLLQLLIVRMTYHEREAVNVTGMIEHGRTDCS